MLDLEADRLEASDKLHLHPKSRKADHENAIKLLKKLYSEYSEQDKIRLKHYLGSVYYTRHREELKKLMPTCQMDVEFSLEEVQKKYDLKYKVK